MISKIVKVLLQRFEQFEIDKRLYQVVTEGLKFAIKYPEEITLMANRNKKSYKGHTPNMVAFSSLIHAVHKFCKEHNTTPRAFVHDPQSEFGPTMRECQEMFAQVRTEQRESGLQFDIVTTNYDLGKFSLTPSKHLTSLQAVDILLWLSQRKDRIKSLGLSEMLMKVSDPFYISRSSSELIRNGWLIKLSKMVLTDEDIKGGEETIAKLESSHKDRLKEFEANKSK